jgi:hypothetical protein
MVVAQNLLDLITRANEGSVNDVASMLAVLKNLCGKEVKYRWVSDDRIFTDGLNTRGLIVLHSDHMYKFTRELQDQCNGVIISYDYSGNQVFDILAVPPGAFDDNYKLGKILRDPSAKIYQAADGTTCTLFWYKSLWVIGTARGCNMNNQSWNGDITFEQALMECSSDYKFNYDSLDKKFIYTVGFSHPKMHPLCVKPTSWLISVSLRGYSHHSDADNLMLLNNLLPSQLHINIDYNTMVSNCNNSISEYLSTKVPMYGYVIRTSTGSYLVRSKLLTFIKKYYHQMPTDIPNDSKVNYANIRGYLSTDRSTYANLFNVSELFSKYDATITDLATKIVSYGRLKASAKQNAPKDSADTIVFKMFKIAEAKGIDLVSNDGYSVIVDLLTNKNNLDLYFDSKLLL